jgi:hypothetical protein
VLERSLMSISIKLINFLMFFLGAVILMPMEARSNPYRTTCQATISLNQSRNLTYQFTGLLPEKSTGETPVNPIGSTLTLTVQQRDRSGQVKTLLKATTLEEYEQVAPDADYSKLPFSGAFRGQPNNGDRLYIAKAAVHGLYVSLRPTRGQPQQIQVVHYRSPGQYLRSTAGTCQVTTATSPTQPPSGTPSDKLLTQLRQTLQAQDWAAADRETRRLLAPESVSARPTTTAVQQPALIRAIDQEWLTASQGRFGLSVQAKIWNAAQATHPKDNEAAVNTFRDRVGWKLTTPREFQDFISSDWRNESEITYSLNAPIGHLPWAGVSDAVVKAIAEPPLGVHCGVCSADARQLRYDRFYSHLPMLFSRVQAALKVH